MGSFFNLGLCKLSFVVPRHFCECNFPDHLFTPLCARLSLPVMNNRLIFILQSEAKKRRSRWQSRSDSEKSAPMVASKSVLLSFLNSPLVLTAQNRS